MELLGKAQILAAADIKTVDIAVDEWGGTIRVRALSLKEGNEWRRSMLKKVPVTDPKTGKTSFEMEFDTELAEMANVSMLSIAIVDEAGNRVFGPEDVEALAKKSIAPVARIAKVIMDISGLSPQSAEDAEKN